MPGVHGREICRWDQRGKGEYGRMKGVEGSRGEKYGGLILPEKSLSGPDGSNGKWVAGFLSEWG